MTFINAKELGIYAPVAGETANLAREAEYSLKQVIFQYKQLYYGLREVAWKHRDKRATFFEALSAGELEQFKVAPGRRTNDGSYTKSEWDYDRLNKYMWERFCEKFDAAFGLERIQGLSRYKDVIGATQELLASALANWGSKILGAKLEVDTVNLSIGQGVSHLEIEHQGIKIEGSFNEVERKVKLSAAGTPSISVLQMNLNETWKSSIGTSQGNLKSKTAADTYAQMISWAGLIFSDIQGFMDNPEGFLGIESKQAKQRNLELIKIALLKINKDSYERRKTQNESQPQLEKLEAPEVISTQHSASNPPKSQPQFHEKLAGELKVYRVDPQTLNRPAQTQPERKKNVLALKRQREREAQAWMQQNAHQLLDTDMDAELGLSEIDAAKINAAATNELPDLD